MNVRKRLAAALGSACLITTALSITGFTHPAGDGLSDNETDIGINGTYLYAYTTDRAPTGGIVRFFDYDEILKVCDLHRDGWYAQGWIRYIDENGWLEADHIVDRNGAQSGCEVANYRIVEGHEVSIKVCLAKTPGGAGRFCSGWKDGIA